MGLILDIVNNVIPRVQDRLAKGENLKGTLIEELEKEIAQSLTDQDKGKEHNEKILNYILTDTKDLNNGGLRR